MRVGGYVRLSRDEDRESYSSILSQKSIIAECVLQNKWTLVKYYEDDNCSGYTFERPGFLDMVRDLENDNIDIVIAKDLSRIGRHNAYTLLFIDKMKKLKKRLILPKEGDGYDTALDDNDLLGIKTWYNEMYVKDISKKIKSSIKAKQKEGRLIIKEHFGYIRSAFDKHILEIDLEAADIVRLIYRLYISGLGYRKIAELLNKEGYPTPSQHIWQRHQQQNMIYMGKISNTWTSSTVQRILNNDIYIGTLRMAKTEKTSIKGKSFNKPRDEQYIFEDNHPAIITKENYNKVQDILDKRKKTGLKGSASKYNIFSGLLFCKDCGSYMIAYSKADKPKSYICGCYHKFGKSSCQRHTISEGILLIIVLEYLKILAIAYKAELGGIVQNQIDSSFDNEKVLLESFKQEQQELKEKYKLLIMQKIMDMKKDNKSQYKNIIQEGFDELEAEFQDRLLYLQRRINGFNENLKMVPQETRLHEWELLQKIINKPKLEKKYMEILIERIIIDRDGNPTIFLKGNTLSICKHIREDVNLVLDQ